MRRSDALLALLAGAALGCAPAKQAVFVDVEALVASEGTPSDAARVPKPPRGLAGSSTSLPGRPAVSLRDPNRAEVRDLAQAIAAEQELEYERLVRRLRRFYAEDAARFELGRLRELNAPHSERMTAAEAAIRALFEAYGWDRTPYAARLATWAGFPDPNPKSVPPPNLRPGGDQKRFDREKTARETLARLREEFDAKAKAILGEIQGLADAEREAALREILAYRAANDLKAEAEAAQQVRTTVRELGLKLATPIQLTLPGLPASSTSMPPGPPPKPAPEVTFGGVLATETERRQSIEHQLAIWLGQRRWVLSRKGAGVRDATQEFATWRKQRTAGR